MVTLVPVGVRFILLAATLASQRDHLLDDWPKFYGVGRLLRTRFALENNAKCGSEYAPFKNGIYGIKIKFTQLLDIIIFKEFKTHSLKIVN
jgi:hypothetical protein